jgi:protein-S-isoprenylcysteine O-methyltransferase Ste14
MRIFSQKGFSFDKFRTNMQLPLICAWLFYFFIHSFLASTGVKNYFSINWPTLFAYYRILYNIIAILGLGILLVLSLPKASQALNIYLGMTLSVTGFILIILAFRAFNLREFLGLDPEKPTKLVVSGMYRYVRHPLYFGTIILIAGLYLLFPSSHMLTILIISYTYIWVGSRLEEQKLR